MTTTNYPPITPLRRFDHAGQAGFLAALVMMTIQFIWRLGWSHNGAVQAFPEFVLAAIARLTPLSIFGAATENYGSLAKKALLVVVVLGIAAVGMWGGRAAGVLTTRMGATALNRLLAGAIVAAILLLITLVVIMPLAGLGFFARQSAYTSSILLQLVITFALYAIVWTIFTDEVFEAEPDFSREQVNRRAFLLDAATLVALLTATGSIWRVLNPRSATSAAADTTAQQVASDIVATQRAGQGYALPTATSVATPRASAMLTSDLAMQVDDPIAFFAKLDAEHKITPVLTATPDFYHVSKNLIDPTVSADGWSLRISGLVQKELTFTHEQLMERATTQRITTLCCISNTLNGDLISTALWQAIPLVDLLNEAGVREGAVDLKFHAADGYEDSVTIDIGMHESNMLVVGMNDAPLPDDHGFPARLIIPNIYGMKNVKWLDSIEVIDHDFKGYWEQSGWDDTATVQIWGRIDYPASGKSIPAGPNILTGVAAAGARDVSRVEVSLDNLASWTDAVLEPSLNPPFTWVRWALPVDLPEGDYQMAIRVTDGEGAVMHKMDLSPLPAGATGWPRRTARVRG